MMLLRALCFAAPIVAFALGGVAHARAPAAIEYAAGSATKVAALAPPKALTVAKDRRGALTSYGYGDTLAPSSGPVIDLRGAFEESAPVAANRKGYSQPAGPAPVEIRGPLDVSPPQAAGEGAMTSADDSFALTAPPPAGLYLVQVGAFAVRDNAERSRDRASVAGDALIDTIDRGGAPLYRVRVGPWPSRDAAEAARASMAGLGFTEARITTAD